ncbi:MAG: hypothetical protein J7M38_10225 [Armatimonadetes bacterium]|nr:hypothetical protein [Armatimonadota bacterium]
MAKIQVTYPNGVTKEYYVTTEFLPSPERTRGRVRQLGSVRFYIKDSLGKIIVRKAGVIRRSKAVKQINEKLENLRDSPDHPAHKCGGRGWDDFIACLRSEMKRVVTPIYTGAPMPSSRSTRIT